MLRSSLVSSLAVSLALFAFAPSHARSAANWTIGTPIVTYWCGPALNDRSATQMADGGFNVVWCGEKDLETAQRHGLRGQLQDGLLTPASLDDANQRQKLDALIERVRRHPALYAYFITDEPSAAQFPALGRLVAYLRERDPEHMAYINLFPTYANNEQLGTKGDTVTAYRQHLREYVAAVKPDLISYDHYQFAVEGDQGQYFLNLGLIRRAAIEARRPFLNIVQACSWTPSMRVPTGDEMRYLIYTTLAYGGQGISYYIYTCAGHTGGIANADGSPTPLFEALKTLNREFVAIARELQPLRSVGAYHAGMVPQGAEALPKDAPVSIEPALPSSTPKPRERVTGALLGYFTSSANEANPTHVVIVNLDYKSEQTFTLRHPGKMELFDANTGRWSAQEGAKIRLQGGAGKLLRLQVTP